MIRVNQAEKRIENVLWASDTKYWVKNVLTAAIASKNFADTLKDARDAEMLAPVLHQRCIALAQSSKTKSFRARRRHVVW